MVVVTMAEEDVGRRDLAIGKGEPNRLIPDPASKIRAFGPFEGSTQAVSPPNCRATRPGAETLPWFPRTGQ